MSEREPGGFVVSDMQADACQCPICQSPFIHRGRKVPVEPCREPVSPVRFLPSVAPKPAEAAT